MSTHPYVAFETIPEFFREGTLPLLSGEIKGTFPYYHIIKAGNSTEFSPDESLQRLFFLIDGSIAIHDNGKLYHLSERGSYIPDPVHRVILTAEKESYIFEISWILTSHDKAKLAEKRPDYPITQLYRECPHYTESFKSEKAVSRTIVPHNIIPRFSMGSNESGENDRVEMNNHPAIDQYFFSFPDNNVVLRIEEEIIPFKGNSILHVPLGAYHGVEIGASQKMHYMWIDFIVDEEAGLEYLNTVHVKLDNNGG